METNENIIDLGEWNFPKSWEELTLKQFQDIERYYSDKEKKFDIRDVIHILTNHTVDEVNMLPIEFSEKIIEGLQWMTEELKHGEPTTTLEIDGVKYSVNIKEKLRTGEYIAVDTLMKDDRYNYAAILAILCRKEGELYDSTFENEVLPSRVELFERQPMVECMRIVSFFLTLWLVLNQNTQLYSMATESIDLTRKHIETLHRNGDISKRYMKSAMGELKKLEKSINSI